jgi:hypothetical protein
MTTPADFIPCSIALRAASSATSWAANGVLLREPLNPFTPAVDQATVLPAGSVTVTMVLLNVDWMWTIPCGTFFLTRFATFFLPAAADAVAMSVPPRYFFLATTRRGPLRVRALV